MDRRPAAYAVCIDDGRVLLALAVGPDGDRTASVWTPVAEVARLRRSSLVDIGIALAQNLPPTGHVTPVRVGGLVQD
ncbi:hypothetical protein ACIBQ3_32785 [Streptomyces rubiginosohelvolus]|uniref:hypothetical protein n=1 Tax=Streptomyces rubiginosohelvolus TaxID=67362 RepID=UPI0037B43179